MAATAKQRMVSAVFRDKINAQNAYTWLLDHGYSDGEVNVLMSDKTRTLHFAANGHEASALRKAKSQAADGVAVGGAIGTAVGASLAALVAIGSAVAIPGIGLVLAGPIAAALAGGGAGAVTGGLIGGLVGMGLTESNARAYEAALREGGVVLGLVPHTEADDELIKTYFEKMGAESVCYC